MALFSLCVVTALPIVVVRSLSLSLAFLLAPDLSVVVLFCLVLVLNATLVAFDVFCLHASQTRHSEHDQMLRRDA